MSYHKSCIASAKINLILTVDCFLFKPVYKLCPSNSQWRHLSPGILCVQWKYKQFEPFKYWLPSTEYHLFKGFKMLWKFLNITVSTNVSSCKSTFWYLDLASILTCFIDESSKREMHTKWQSVLSGLYKESDTSNTLVRFRCKPTWLINSYSWIWINCVGWKLK